MTSAALEDRGGSLWIGLIGAACPMARQGRMGILDGGAGPALGFDLEHPAGPERSALGRDFPRPGAPGWAIAADQPGPRRTASEATTSDGWARPSDGSIWAVIKPGGLARLQPATGKVHLVSQADLACGRRESRLCRPSGSYLASDLMRSLPQRASLPFRTASSALINPQPFEHGAWAVTMDQSRGDVDHQSRWALALARWRVASLRETRWPAERRCLHSGLRAGWNFVAASPRGRRGRTVTAFRRSHRAGSDPIVSGQPQLRMT